MNAIAINGSPRKTWNTATLLENALSGCGESYGRCNMRDELSPLLNRVAQADILILGSPFYFHTETGEMRSFMEHVSTRWDPAVKARRRKEVFPRDCRRAYDLGARLAAAARCS